MTVATSTCGVCAPRVSGKSWALLTTSAEAGGVSAWHRCYSSTGNPVNATSRVISWHVSREATMAARLAFRRAHKGARCYAGKLGA
jgi:hypothetical protein